MNYISAYLMVCLAVWICKEVHGMTPDECYAALMWPLVFLFLYWILFLLEDDGV